MEAMVRSESSNFAAVLFGLLFLGAAVGRTKAIFTGQMIFGDAQADVGTNVFLNNTAPSFYIPPTEANFPPYGRSFFFPLSLTGNPTGRFGDGLLVPDFFAFFMGVPFSQPYLALAASNSPFRFNQGANFASAGSGILDTTNEIESVNDLPAQMAQFLQVVATIRQTQPLFASQIIGNLLFFFNFGPNDILYYFETPTRQLDFTIEQYVSLLADLLKSSIQVAIDNGARKIIVTGIGPFGCEPQRVAFGFGACSDSFNQLAVLFNTLVAGHVSELNANGTAKVSFANSYQFVLNAIQNGRSLGFTQGSVACCGSGAFNGLYQCGKGSYNLCPIYTQDQYVFWDFRQLTQKMNSLIANLYWFGGGPNIQPYSGLQLQFSL